MQVLFEGGSYTVLSFQLLKLRKICGKNWEKQNWFYGGLLSRTRYFSEGILTLRITKTQLRKGKYIGDVHTNFRKHVSIHYMYTS